MLSFDVHTWVPRIYIVAGLDAVPVAPLVQMGARVKRFVSLHTGRISGVAMGW